MAKSGQCNLTKTAIYAVFLVLHHGLALMVDGQDFFGTEGGADAAALAPVGIDDDLVGLFRFAVMGSGLDFVLRGNSDKFTRVTESLQPGTELSRASTAGDNAVGRRFYGGET
jgi:hypothetical protein